MGTSPENKQSPIRSSLPSNYNNPVNWGRKKEKSSTSFFPWDCLSWYQGDIETDDEGEGHGRFIGRFNIETFIVAPNVAPAPVVHNQSPFPDASTNPATAPVHTFHLGLWFNSSADAVKAGCPGAVTPFNGDHTAGIQVLSTRNFANDQGPLRQLIP